MEKFEAALRRVRERTPLVQCITNFVTVNDCANILLASGASPTMAHDIREAAEAVTGADALVCNMGAIEDTDAMILAGKQANRLGKPVILDPVAAGGTALRRESAGRLLSEIHFAVIRGNASEIRGLAGETAAGSGVDAGVLDVVTEENLLSSLEMVRSFSGAIDIISDGNNAMALRGGCATMARITGSGCMLTTLIGAFCGAMPDDFYTASCAAMAAMNVCGELAEKRRLTNGTGNATFRTPSVRNTAFLLSSTTALKLPSDVTPTVSMWGSPILKDAISGR